MTILYLRHLNQGTSCFCLVERRLPLADADECFRHGTADLEDVYMYSTYAPRWKDYGTQASSMPNG